MGYCWIDRDRKYFIATCSSLALVTVPKMSPSNNYLALKDHFFRPHTGEERGIVARNISNHEQRADIQVRVIRKFLMEW
jgi:hypothetical protein